MDFIREINIYLLNTKAAFLTNAVGHQKHSKGVRKVC